MSTTIVTPLDIARRFLGTSERAGADSNNPAIMAMLQLDESWPANDEVAWCSAFVNYVCWLLNLPRSRSLGARTWLKIGLPVALEDARPGNDVVVFARGGDHQPGPEVIRAPGHVAFFLSATPTHVTVLGANQGDAVSIASFPVRQVLGVRRLS